MLNDQAEWIPVSSGRGVYCCTTCGNASEWHFGISIGPVLLKEKTVNHDHPELHDTDHEG